MLGRTTGRPRLLLFIRTSYSGRMIRTIHLGLMTAAIALSASAHAQAPGALPTAPALSLEQRTMLRCSAAFAIVARQQADGKAAAKRYPPMDPRGKEFFVRASAQVMEQTRMTREQIQAVLEAEAQGLSAPGRLDAVMPACLLSLDASGL